MKHTWIIGAAVLQSACSLLIEVEDGVDEEVGHSQGGSMSDPELPDAGVPDAEAGSSGGGGAGGTYPGNGAGARGTVPEGGGTVVAGSGGVGSSAGAGGSDPDAGAAGSGGSVGSAEQPTFDLAFIEDPDEADATLRLVSSERALRSPEETPSWRITLSPADQVGDVIDFAWSPDGERIAVRFEGLRGPRLALFAAPDWQEIDRQEAGSLAEPSELDATPNYRWSPSGDALAAELSGGQQPLVSGYVIENGAAFGLEPVPVVDPIVTMDWLSDTSLYVIQSEDDEPELIEVRLDQRAFEAVESEASSLGVSGPVELRQVPGGLIAASADPNEFLFFWPTPAAEGLEASYYPWAYLPDNEALVAEFDDVSETTIFSLGEQSSALDALPGCATVLGWTAGPDRSSLAGSTIACLPVAGEPAVISVYSYEADSSRSVVTIDDELLRSDLAAAENWEGHAHGLSPGGQFLALASSTHDVLIDWRASPPRVRVGDASGQGSTARGFSSRGQFMLRQRGRSVDLVVLSAADDASTFDLPDAFVDMPPCELAHHSTNWCGARSAARRASARWSKGSDFAAHLTSERGLVVIGATADPVSVRREPVSTCGASCIRQYEFGR